MRAAVHGDDFTLPGWSESLDWFGKQINKRFKCKHRGRIGPAKGDDKQIRILNRIVTWTKRGIEYEGDQRHVEIAMKEYGLDKGSNALSLPGGKDSKEIEDDKELDKSEAKRCRGSVARMEHLGQDRSDIQFSVKELSKKMAQPTAGDETKMKRLIRYLIGRPRYINIYNYQDKPMSICTC